MSTKPKKRVVVRKPQNELHEEETGIEEVEEEEVQEPEPEEEEYAPAESLVTDAGKIHLRFLVGRTLLVQGSVALDITEVVRGYSYGLGQLTLATRHIFSEKTDA